MSGIDNYCRLALFKLIGILEDKEILEKKDVDKFEGKKLHKELVKLEKQIK